MGLGKTNLDLNFNMHDAFTDCIDGNITNKHIDDDDGVNACNTTRRSSLPWRITTLTGLCEIH